ncbi:Na+/H+ antiporter subunit E [bacterium]|nr:Na+/H+ antiporter subunit E [bacterium]
MKLSRYIFVFLIILLLWILLIWPIDAGKLILGAGIALITAIPISMLFKTGMGALNPMKLLWIILYIPFFLYKLLMANIQIAMVVLSPKINIKPAILKAKTDLKNDTAKLWLANSITLTPGTLTVDVKGDEIFVHCVNPGDKKNWLKEKVLMPFEKFLKGGIDES